MRGDRMRETKRKRYTRKKQCKEGERWREWLDSWRKKERDRRKESARVKVLEKEGTEHACSW